MVDEEKFGCYVDRTEGFDITTVASWRSPVIEGSFIERAFGHVRQLPALAPPQMPDHSVLEQIIAATAQPGT